MGDFSRATHLSVKTPRHYHQTGLLEPAAVNPDTGYRYYSAGQIPAAQVIRRLRDLEMPVADVNAVLAAPDSPAATSSSPRTWTDWRPGWPIFRADASRAYG